MREVKQEWGLVRPRPSSSKSLRLSSFGSLRPILLVFTLSFSSLVEPPLGSESELLNQDF